MDAPIRRWDRVHVKMYLMLVNLCASVLCVLFEFAMCSLCVRCVFVQCVFGSGIFYLLFCHFISNHRFRVGFGLCKTVCLSVCPCVCVCAFV